MVRTHPGGAHPADRSADDQLSRILCNATYEGAGLEKCDGGHEDPLGRIDTHDLSIEQEENCLSQDE